jgi:hypothetical protein
MKIEEEQCILTEWKKIKQFLMIGSFTAFKKNELLKAR